VETCPSSARIGLEICSWRRCQPEAQLLFPLRGALLAGKGTLCGCGICIAIIGIISSQGIGLG